VEKYCRKGQTTDENRCMRIACWIPKATNTHSQYIICNNTYVSLYVNCLSFCIYAILVLCKTVVSFSFKKPSSTVTVSFVMGHHKILLLLRGMIPSVKPCKYILQASILCGDMPRR